jgi:hypothetical protein
MQVIADLHGGDLEDALAKAEFQEIKDRVNFDVSHPSLTPWSSQHAKKSCTAGIWRGAFLQSHVGEVQTQSFIGHVIPGLRSTSKRRAALHLQELTFLPQNGINGACSPQTFQGIIDKL